MLVFNVVYSILLMAVIIGFVYLIGGLCTGTIVW